MTKERMPWNKGKGNSYEETRVRFESKIEELVTNCWRWKGHIENNGYGRFWHLGKQVLAHRLSYMIYRGPIDFGLTVDHLCRNTWCVNPSHLELVTRIENVKRGTNNIIKNATKTHCTRGHVYSGENLYIKPNGERDCKMCNLIRNKVWREKHRS